MDDGRLLGQTDEVRRLIRLPLQVWQTCNTADTAITQFEI